MKRKLHIAGKGPDDWIRIADADGKVVCALPRVEVRIARFIVWSVNLFGFGLRPYDKHDWWMEKNRGAIPSIKYPGRAMTNDEFQDIAARQNAEEMVRAKAS